VKRDQNGSRSSGSGAVRLGRLGSIRPGRLVSSETLSLTLSAIAVGTLAGFAAVGFLLLVEGTGEGFAWLRVQVGWLPAALVTLLTPALGGLLLAPIVVRVAPEVRGSGLPHVLVAYTAFGGRVARSLLLWRPIGTALSVGSGAALGPEGPVVQMGASLASGWSRLFHLNDERRRNLVAVAAAGGIAAVFNAPIAGVLFALEEILGKFEGRFFSLVVIGSVSATAVSRSFLGAQPAFPVPADYSLTSPLELPLYLLLGVLTAGLGVAVGRALVGGDDLFNRARIHPWLRPALGGLVVGAIAIALPQVLGVGYATTGAILNEELRAPLLLAALVLGKIVATSAAIGSWGSGGILAPVLMIGASFGALFGEAAHALLPQLAVQPGAYALVGMAALFAAVTRASLTSIVMVFELSGSYAMILPLLLGAVIATLVADAIQPTDYYETMVARRGLSLLPEHHVDLLQTVRVAEVMDREVPKVRADASLHDLAGHISSSHHHGFVVVPGDEPDRMVGFVTLSDLEAARQAARPPSTPVREICSREVHVTDPDEPASTVLERMGRLGIERMPVVRPAAPDRPIAFVRQSDLARAYYLALHRERSHEELHAQLRLRELTGHEIVEVRVPPEAPLRGVPLREAGLPRESIVIAIRRGGRTLFPHGDTTLEAGDTVVANVAPGFGPRFRARIVEGAGGEAAAADGEAPPTA
jgi:CIC family chloride channel protein